MKKLIFIFITLGFVACGRYFYINHQFRNIYSDANALLHNDSAATPFLKAHMKNGDVYVFGNTWKINNDKTILSGKAAHYDFNRTKLDTNSASISISEVAIFETNIPVKNLDEERITGLTVVSVIDLGFGLVCLINPKACFGSCPTFYYQNDNNVHFANAEGFSSSIAPSLEAADIDALNNPLFAGSDFTLTMKNEALETHAINQVKLLAVPRNNSSRVFHDKMNRFYACDNLVPVKFASVDREDITDRIKNIDEAEWYSLTDSNDLKAQQTINLVFPNYSNKNNLGLVINFRQTLLTTFLLYSAYGYMGDEVGDIFAEIETDKNIRKLLGGTQSLVDEIEVYVFNDKENEWEHTGSLYETGPIAKNLQLIALPEDIRGQNVIKIQLRLSKGLWRIDYAALATISNAVTPIEISPDKVVKNGLMDKDALVNLSADDSKYQTSLPGDNYKLHFTLPDTGKDYELFVFSKGYYLEWIRNEWLHEKNLSKLKKMLSGDKETWHSLAMEFKAVEGNMEETFWNSKVSQ